MQEEICDIAHIFQPLSITKHAPSRETDSLCTPLGTYFSRDRMTERVAENRILKRCFELDVAVAAQLVSRCLLKSKVNPRGAGIQELVSTATSLQGCTSSYHKIHTSKSAAIGHHVTVLNGGVQKYVSYLLPKRNPLVRQLSVTAVVDIHPEPRTPV